MALWNHRKICRSYLPIRGRPTDRRFAGLETPDP